MSARILIVDDMEFNLELTARLLKLHGFNTIFANNGKQAVQITEEELPDIVLLDIGLPDIDGWDVIDTLKDIESTKNIPIIALTAHDTIAHKNRAKSSGCAGFLTKPIEIETLLSEINKSI